MNHGGDYSMIINQNVQTKFRSTKRMHKKGLSEQGEIYTTDYIIRVQS